MPFYDFRDKNTGEVWEQMMSYDDKVTFLAENTDVEAVITAVAFVSGIAGVTHKNDSGFGDLMSRIADANPTSPLADQYGSKSIKAVKTRQAVDREKTRQAAREK